MSRALSEFEALLDKNSRLFDRALLAVGAASRHKESAAWTLALADLTDLIRHTLILCNLYGRRTILRRLDSLADAAIAGIRFSDVSENTPLEPGLTFDESVARMLKADPRLAEDFREVQRLYSSEKVFAMARSASQNVTERVQKEVAKLMEVGTSSGEIENAILEIGRSAEMGAVRDWTQAYAATVFQTNANTANSEGRMQQMLDPEVEEVLPSMELIGVDDFAERENHAAARGLIAPTNHPIWSRFRPPLGYNCFLPGTLVSGRFSCASKAPYSGPAVEIVTRNGARLSVTANHPVLTPLGWVAANELREGDDLFSDQINVNSFDRGGPPVSSVGSAGRAVHNQKMPARVEDVFDTFLFNAGSGSIGPVESPLDFHGDARWFDGNIHVVSANGHLQGGSLEMPGNCSVDIIYMQPASGAPSALNGDSPPGNRAIGMGGVSGALPGGGTLTLNNTSVVSAPFKRSPLCYFGIGPASSWDAISLKEADNSSIMDIVNSCEFASASAGAVCRDKVVTVRRFKFSGHVYNLESDTGWIVSDRVVTSNCRHGLNPVSIFELERRGIGRGEVYYPPSFARAHPDPGFEVKRGVSF